MERQYIGTIKHKRNYKVKHAIKKKVGQSHSFIKHCSLANTVASPNRQGAISSDGGELDLLTLPNHKVGSLGG